MQILSAAGRGGASPETIAYVWGCGTPTLPLFRDHTTASEAARQVAITHGWNPTREGAWACEMTLPARRDAALRALSAEAQRDSAVEGFSVA